jgi:hypothetical protein
MWDPRRLTTLCAFTVCFRGCFTFHVTSNNNRTLVYSRTGCLSLEGAGSQTYSRDQHHMDWIILKNNQKASVCRIAAVYIQVSKSTHFLKVSLVFTNSAHRIAQYRSVFPYCPHAACACISNITTEYQSPRQCVNILFTENNIREIPSYK